MVQILDLIMQHVTFTFAQRERVVNRIKRQPLIAPIREERKKDINIYLDKL